MKNMSIFLEEIGLDISGLQIDHLGLKIKNTEDAENLKSDILENSGEIISKAIVAGRPIYILKLSTPLVFMKNKVYLIELPFPKENHKYKTDGWQHFEVVLPGKVNSLNEFRTVFEDKFPNFDVTRDDLNIEFENPQGEESDLPNPTISIASSTNNMLEVKFHPRSLDDVVNGNALQN